MNFLILFFSLLNILVLARSFTFIEKVEGLQKFMGKSKVTQKAARRIQSSQDKKGSKGDKGFKSRAMSAADKKGKK